MACIRRLRAKFATAGILARGNIPGYDQPVARHLGVTDQREEGPMDRGTVIQADEQARQNRET